MPLRTWLDSETTKDNKYNRCQRHRRLCNCDDPHGSGVDHKKESCCQRDGKQYQEKHEVICDGGTFIICQTNKEIYDGSVADGVSDCNWY